MRQHDPNHQSSADAEDSIWTILPVALIVVLTMGVLTMSVLRHFNFGPSIGDVIVFQPTSGPEAADSQQRADVTVRRAGESGTCVLNPTAMAIEGGSLVVERATNAGQPMFQVHWAGHRTSAGATNCGQSADLLVLPNDLLDLAGAAGGFGVNHKVVLSAGTLSPSATILD